jgi:hypothetical protein
MASAADRILAASWRASAGWPRNGADRLRRVRGEFHRPAGSDAGHRIQRHNCVAFSLDHRHRSCRQHPDVGCARRQTRSTHPHRDHARQRTTSGSASAAAKCKTPRYCRCIQQCAGPGGTALAGTTLRTGTSRPDTDRAFSTCRNDRGRCCLHTVTARRSTRRRRHRVSTTGRSSEPCRGRAPHRKRPVSIRQTPTAGEMCACLGPPPRLISLHEMPRKAPTGGTPTPRSSGGPDERSGSHRPAVGRSTSVAEACNDGPSAIAFLPLRWARLAPDMNALFLFTAP